MTCIIKHEIDKRFGSETRTDKKYILPRKELLQHDVKLRLHF